MARALCERGDRLFGMFEGQRANRPGRAEPLLRRRPSRDSSVISIFSNTSVLRHVAGHGDEELIHRTVPLRRSHGLAAMHAAAHAGDFAVAVSEHRIESADIDFHLAAADVFNSFSCSRVNAKAFHSRRLACQGFTNANCSGNRDGSAAALNASRPRMADA